jgi:hypothetical protein
LSDGITAFTAALNTYALAIAVFVDTPPYAKTTALVEAATALGILATALTQAIAAFEAQAPTYLSQKVNIG